MTAEKKKDPKVTIVDFNTFTDYEFIPPSTFYIQNAMGEYWFCAQNQYSPIAF